ncbi:MAG: hypothetical protein B6U87_00425 [Candidatus Aenigmarchaeota archaeon ex4484_52]|nr:MAG: hypothetical protein B6U87_00425 [Candidatus Aenigmarchaeota archaeon ex4484_52]
MLNIFDLKEKYDIIVIGAGPGGCKLAELCAKKGLDCLVLEKRQEIGAPKRCAEGIGKEHLLNLGFSGNEKFILNEITTGSILYAPNGQHIILPIKNNKTGYILERKLFDKEMASKAALAGAKIFAKCDVVDAIIENDFVCGVEFEYYEKKYKIKSDIVISAEGVEAKIARNVLNLPISKPDEIMSGYQYEIENIDLDNSHRLEFYIGVDISPGGYIWIFPKGKKKANIGLGIYSNTKHTAKYYLDKWINTKSNLKKGSVLEENAGAIPVGGLLKKMTANGFLTIGDAARQVHPLHGGGLYESTYAAKIAADVITDAKLQNDFSDKFLDKYNKIWWEKRGDELLRVNKIKKCFHKISDEDFNLLIKSVKDTHIANIMKGNVFEISKIILKNPKLIKFSKYFILK